MVGTHLLNVVGVLVDVVEEKKNLFFIINSFKKIPYTRDTNSLDRCG